MKSQDKRLIRISFVALVLVLIAFVSLSIGGSSLSFSDTLSWFFGRLHDESALYILNDLRFPRTMTLLGVGFSLSLAGLLLQGLLDNPLAEPYTIGLSGGATLGAVIGLILGVSPQWLTMPVSSLMGCLIAGLVLIFCYQRFRVLQGRNLILVGLMISLFCGSLVVTLLSLLDPQQLFTAMHWMMGYCGTPRDLWWPMTWSVATAAIVWTLWRHRALDSLLLGDDLAGSLKIPLKQVRSEILLSVALLTAAAVAQMGLVGFVGLLAPHFGFLVSKSRRLRKTLIPTVASGAILLTAADVLGRWIGDSREIPAGSLVSLLGAPFLMFLLFRRGKNA